MEIMAQRPIGIGELQFDCNVLKIDEDVHKTIGVLGRKIGLLPVCTTGAGAGQIVIDSNTIFETQSPIDAVASFKQYANTADLTREIAEAAKSARMSLTGKPHTLKEFMHSFTGAESLPVSVRPLTPKRLFID